MKIVDSARSLCHYAGLSAALLSTLANLFAPPVAAAHNVPQPRTTTPIKHVIVIIGENRTFDHVYATYKPRRGEFVSNLLSKRIVNEDGTPGPNYSQSAQYSAVDNDTYSLGPDNKDVYDPLPPPTTSYVSTVGSDTAPPPFATLPVATFFETDLTTSANPFLISGASGLPMFTVDTRIDNVNSLREGVYQITRKLSYDSYTGDPVHRFYQMWQQYDCRASNITRWNPSGCSQDLFPWVEVTIGTGRIHGDLVVCQYHWRRSSHSYASSTVPGAQPSAVRCAAVSAK